MSVPQFRSYRCRDSLVNVVSPNKKLGYGYKGNNLRKLTSLE